MSTVSWLTEGTPVDMSGYEDVARKIVRKYGKRMSGTRLWRVDKYTSSLWPIDREDEDQEDYYRTLKKIILALRKRGHMSAGLYGFSYVEGETAVSIVGGVAVTPQLIRIVELYEDGDTYAKTISLEDG